MKLLLTLAALLLLGCQSVGKQYAVPTENEGVAQYQATGFGTFIHSVDEQGCYTGRTHIADGTKLRADREVMILIEAKHHGISSYEAVCRVLFAFTPRAGATYTHQYEHWYVKKSPDVFGDTRGPLQCTARPMLVAPDGTKTAVPARYFRLSQRKLTCIGAEPIRPALPVD